MKFVGSDVYMLKWIWFSTDRLINFRWLGSVVSQNFLKHRARESCLW